MHSKPQIVFFNRGHDVVFPLNSSLLHQVHVAAQHAHAEVVRVLLDAGGAAQLAATDVVGQLPARKAFQPTLSQSVFATFCITRTKNVKPEWC